MEKLIFATGHVLPLAPMGINNTGAALDIRAFSPLSIEEEKAEIERGADHIALCTEAGQEIQVYTNFNKVQEIGREYTEEGSVLHVVLRAQSDVEKHLDEIDTALVELAGMIGGV